MEQQSTKIKFYVKRSFGEKLNVTFDFIKQNWKTLLKYSTYLILPLCMIQAFLLNKMAAMSLESPDIAALIEAYGFEALPPGYLLYNGCTMLFAMIGGMLITAVIFGLMQIYNEREQGLTGITFNDLKPYLLRNMWRYFLVVLFLIVLSILYVIAMVLLGALLPVSLALTVPLMLVLLIPLSLIVPIYLFERIGMGGALVKSFRLGFPTWIGIFGVGLLLGIIALILQTAMSLPWLVVTMVQQVFTMSEYGDVASSSAGYGIALYLLGVLSMYGVYLSMTFTFVGLSYQYAHASEKVNSVSVVDDIDNFEQL